MGNYLDHKPKLSARQMKQRLESEQAEDRAQEKAAIMESRTAGFRISNGYYTRSSPVECIIAVRGNPAQFCRGESLCGDGKPHAEKP